MPPRTRSTAPVAPDLPTVALADEPGTAAVLALPTRPAEARPAEARPAEAENGDAGPAVVLADAPDAADLPGLLAREKAKGTAGEVVGLPLPGDGPL